MNQPHVLIVDDDPGHRALLRDVLEGEGYAVQQAEDGKVALRCLEQTGVDRFALLLVDLVMPKVGGLTLLRRVREMWGDRLPPVLVCTGRADKETVAAVQKRHVSAYVLKPYVLDDLIERIRKTARPVGGHGTPLSTNEEASGHGEP